MEEYSVEVSKRTDNDLKKLRRSGRKTDIAKVEAFFAEIESMPRSGTGDPERLRHHQVETWSRRVNQKDRFVYEVYEEEMRIVVKQALGHYADR